MKVSRKKTLGISTKAARESSPAGMSKELLGFLSKLHDQSIKLLRELRFNKQLHADGYIVCLYASMIELCGGIITLVESGRQSSLSSVVRTFLEAYVDFENLRENPNYIFNCYARHHENWIKVLSDAQQSNPYLAGIHRHEFRERAALKRHQSELQRLKKEGFAPLQIATRFGRAGMAEEYRSLYHLECEGTHNSLQALMKRHMELGEDGFELALYRDLSPDDYAAQLSLTARLLLDATLRIHARLKSGREKDIDPLGYELAHLVQTGRA